MVIDIDKILFLNESLSWEIRTPLTRAPGVIAAHDFVIPPSRISRGYVVYQHQYLYERPRDKQAIAREWYG